MSKAFKCNRCGTCFDPYAVLKDRYFITIGEYMAQDGTTFFRNETSWRAIDTHLCPTCTEYFEQFMENQPYALTVHLNDEERRDAFETGFKEGLGTAQKLLDCLRDSVSDILVDELQRRLSERSRFIDSESYAVKWSKCSEKDGE